MGKEKVVIDTNIFISALGWEGKPRDLFRRVIADDFELFVSRKQLAEIRRVLEYPKFGFSNEQKERFLEIILKAAILVETGTAVNVIKEDPSDNMLVECALETKAGYVISGDDHLKKIGTYKGIFFLSVDEFLKRSP